MSLSRIRLAALAVFGSLAVGGCAYGPYGGYGGGVSVGYGSPYYNDGYYGRGYGYNPYYGSGYGYGYGRRYPSYGWYNGYYYPGTGIYVYDRYRRPHRMSNAHRRYWEQRRQVVGNRQVYRQDRRDDRRDYREERRDDRRDLRRGVVSQEQFRRDRRDDRRDYRQERREDRQVLRRKNKRDDD